MSSLFFHLFHNTAFSHLCAKLPHPSPIVPWLQMPLLFYFALISNSYHPTPSMLYCYTFPNLLHSPSLSLSLSPISCPSPFTHLQVNTLPLIRNQNPAKLITTPGGWALRQVSAASPAFQSSSPPPPLPSRRISKHLLNLWSDFAVPHFIVMNNGTGETSGATVLSRDWQGGIAFGAGCGSRPCCGVSRCFGAAKLIRLRSAAKTTQSLGSRYCLTPGQCQRLKAECNFGIAFK